MSVLRLALGNLRNKTLCTESVFQSNYIQRLRCTQVINPSITEKDDEIYDKPTGNSDVFGIESDEGAVFFNDSAVRLEKFKNLIEKGKRPHTTRRTTFGSVRRDNANEEQVTKQVRQRASEYFDETQPYSKTMPRITKSQINQPMYSEHISPQTTNALKSVSDCQILPPEKLQHELNNEQPLGMNYIDDYYFKKDLSISTQDMKSTESPSVSYSQVTVEEKNTGATPDASEYGYIDCTYFSDTDADNTDVPFTGSLETRQPVQKVCFVPKDVSRTAKNHVGMPVKHEMETSSFQERSQMKDRTYLKDSTSVKSKRKTENKGKNTQFGDTVADSRLLKKHSRLVEDAAASTDIETCVWDEVKEVKSKTDVSEQKPDVDEKVNAIDFIKDLRKAKGSKISPNEGSIASSGVKLDSKGFRILSGQVPDLRALTRDELIVELKSRVLYLDDDLLVLDKPYNLVMHNAESNKDVSLESVLDGLSKAIGGGTADSKLITVHRLDKTTTGCLMLARNEMTAMHLKSLFAQRKIKKKYWIVTINIPEHNDGVIEIPISEGTIASKSRMVLRPNIPKDMPYRSHCRHGKTAITRYSVISTSGSAALIEAEAETGIKHQIRAHFGFGLNCPILGDHKYSYLDKLVPQKLPSDMLQRLNIRQSKVRHVPMHIHARSIVIPNYLEGRNLFAYAALPDHMRKNLKSLRFRKK